MSKAYEIFDEAFSKPRDPRSDEYRHGVIDILKFRLREANEVFGKHQYKLGTAQADAYFAGCDEGHRLAREYLEKVGDGKTAPNVLGEGPPEREARREPASAACRRSLSTGGLEPFLRGEAQTLPPGWKFQSFASGDDEIRADGNQSDTKQDKSNANDAVAPGVPGEDAARLISGGAHDGRLKGMVDPLAKPDEETPSGNCGCRGDGKCLQQPGAGKQEDDNTHDHENLIPVVKRKLGEWVRAFHRRMRTGWMKGSNGGV